MLYRNKDEPKNQENIKFNNPLLFCFLLTLLQLVFPVSSGAMISILQLNEFSSRLIQAVFFLLAGILGCIIAWRVFGTLQVVGIRKARLKDAKVYLWFVPILLIELSTLGFGLKEGLSVQFIFVYLFFTIAVGFSEELYFRGLIPKILNGKNLIQPLLISSFLFSIGHFFNLLAGASLTDTLLQVIFAFLYGVVALEIRLLTGSLAVPVLWHISHNFLSLITVANHSGAFLFGLIQGTVLFFYGIYLWSKLFLQKSAVEML